MLSRYRNFHQSNQTCDLAGAGVNQAAGRQLAVAALDTPLQESYLSLCLIKRNAVKTHVWRDWSIAPRILNLGESVTKRYA
jgi:hypothetical protein